MHEMQLYTPIIALEIMMGLGQIRRNDMPRTFMSSPATTAAPTRKTLMGIAPFALIIFCVLLADWNAARGAAVAAS